MRATNYPAIAKVLAFLAVSSSIAAVGWSIQDFSVVAVGIPGLAAGHLYSWRRREASIVRSLILLLFMVLTVFLGEDILRSGLSDRLLLSRYLIYGLVLGSFDLMRKRHVMASVILSLASGAYQRVSSQPLVSGICGDIHSSGAYCGRYQPHRG